MKVLHVISSLGIGGAERLISDMLPQMKKVGEDVSLLVYRRLNNEFEEKLEESGVPLISLELKNNLSPWIIYSLIKTMKGFDLIHVHLFPALYQVAIANLLCHRKLIYTEHNTTNKRRNLSIFRGIEKLIYSRYSHIISVSVEVRNNLSNWLETKDSKVSVINNGIDIEAYRIPRGTNDYPFTLLMVSRFVPAKDQMTVIRAMKRLSDDVHVVFVGDGETRKACEELADKLGVAERCHFVGMQSNVPFWISKADVGILSTHWEGLPLTVLEMMAGGLPVVASDVEGLKQVVEGAGILFNEEDDSDLANIISELIENQEYYSSVVVCCRERVNEYSIMNTIKGYIQVYYDSYDL